jgi:hypothetical protein
MEWLNIIGPILGIAALGFFTWRMEKNKVQSPAAWGLLMIAVLVLVVWLKGWGSEVVLLFLLALSWIEHLPTGVFYAAGIGIFCFACWYLFKMLGNSIIELAQEMALVRERIALMERSLRDKLDDIAKRFPEAD